MSTGIQWEEVDDAGAPIGNNESSKVVPIRWLCRRPSRPDTLLFHPQYHPAATGRLLQTSLSLRNSYNSLQYYIIVIILNFLT